MRKKVDVYYLRDDYFKIIEYAFTGELSNDQFIELQNRLYDVFGFDYKLRTLFISDLKKYDGKLEIEI